MVRGLKKHGNTLMGEKVKEGNKKVVRTTKYSDSVVARDDGDGWKR